MKSLARIRKRHGRCYELAVHAMIYESESDQWTLVHGRLDLSIALGRTGLKGWYDHAWIELDDGRIYDPVHNDYTPATIYIAKWRAVVDHRYSRREMSCLISTTRNSGPWTDDERRASVSQR